MGQKDLAQSDYFNDKARFADACNGILFQGRKSFTPVIMIVIYYGMDKAWDGATCLYDMLDMEEELEPYVTNYKMNLFDYHDYEDFSFFKTENRELFEVLSCAKDEKRMDELLYGNIERYRRLPADAVNTIFDITGIDLKLNKVINEEGREVVDVCKAWDDHKESGRREGREEGRREGRAEDIRNLMESLKVSALQAMDILKISKAEQDKYLSLLK